MSDATDLPDLVASIWYHRTYARKCLLHAEHALNLKAQLLRLQYTVSQLHQLHPTLHRSGQTAHVRLCS